MRLPPKTKSNKPTHKQRYPLGEIPLDVITAIGRQIIHRLAVGMADIGGDDFGNIFAEAIGGEHANKPEGLADVSWNGCAWSVKTIKNSKPYIVKQVRLISGRNSPTYSQDIRNLLKNPQQTGTAVLDIWNARVGQARHQHDNLRVVVMIRSIERLEFTLFEEEVGVLVPANYKWSINNNKNLVGRDITTEQHAFTWQPGGGQFTIFRGVPASAVHFKLKRPELVSQRFVLDKIGYGDDWVTLIKPPHNHE